MRSKRWLLCAVLLVFVASIVTIQADSGKKFVSVKKKISAENGGTISIKYDGDTYAALHVNAGALDKKTKIKIKALLYKEKDDEGKYKEKDDEEKDAVAGLAVEFGPDGLKFNPPYAVFSLERPLLKKFVGSQLYVWDEAGNVLWASGKITKSVKRINLRLRHFSLYYFERR